MPTILSFNHGHYLVPDSVNVSVLLKSLAGLKRMEYDFKPDARGRHRDFYKPDDSRTGELAIKVVAADQVLGPKKPKQLPAKASPDANGDMGV